MWGVQRDSERFEMFPKVTEVTETWMLLGKLSFHTVQEEKEKQRKRKLTQVNEVRADIYSQAVDTLQKKEL